MKKRMFLSTILMTLVLLLAVTTATFAWYEVSSQGEASLSKTEASLGTVIGEYKAGAVALVGKITTTDNVALTDAKGDSWVIANGSLVKAQDNDDLTKVGVATLSVEWPTLTGTDEEKLAQKLAYAGTYIVSIKGDRVKLSKVNTEGSEAYRSTEDVAIELTVTIDGTNGKITIENNGVFYFAIDGTGAEDNNDGSSVKQFPISATMKKSALE